MFKKTRNVKRIIERYGQEPRNFNIDSKKIFLYGSYAKGNPRDSLPHSILYTVFAPCIFIYILHSNRLIGQLNFLFFTIYPILFLHLASYFCIYIYSRLADRGTGRLVFPANDYSLFTNDYLN
jgi:hypothetical protein